MSLSRLLYSCRTMQRLFASLGHMARVGRSCRLLYTSNLHACNRASINCDVCLIIFHKDLPRCQIAGVQSPCPGSCPCLNALLCLLQASGRELVMVSRIAVLVWACIMGAAICIFQAAGVNVYWLTIWNGIICAGESHNPPVWVPHTPLRLSNHWTSSRHQVLGFSDWKQQVVRWGCTSLSLLGWFFHREAPRS